MAESPVTNVLVIMADQFRHDYMGCAGADFVHTPNIDALAAAGTRFTQCITNAPVCSPARIALATGLLGTRTGGMDNCDHLPRHIPTYYQRFRDWGYRVGCVGKLDLSKPYGYNGREGRRPLTYTWGFTDPVEIEGKMHAGGQPTPRGPYGHMLQEKGLYESFHRDYIERAHKGWATEAHDSVLPPEDFADTYVGKRSEQWLEQITDEYPWHLFVSFPGPHDPFDPPTCYADRYRLATMPPAVPAGDALGRNGRPMADREIAPETVQKTRRQYCASITAIDDAIGGILAVLDKRGMRENTLIVFSSDHGEMLGDHAAYTKSVPYEAAVRVPLIVAGPGVAQGAVSDSLVELLDVNATLCEMAGIPPLEHVDACSFAPVLRGQTQEHRDCTVSLLTRLRLVRTRTHKFVRNLNAPGELYDLESDPHEQHNIAGEHPEICRELSGWLGARLCQPVYGGRT
jgi:arylsulfatase